MDIEFLTIYSRIESDIIVGKCNGPTENSNDQDQMSDEKGVARCIKQLKSG